MFKITRIRVTENGTLRKVRHTDILTDNLELTRSELLRQYKEEYKSDDIQVSFTYREGDCEKLMNESDEE